MIPNSRYSCSLRFLIIRAFTFLELLGGSNIWFTIIFRLLFCTKRISVLGRGWIKRCEHLAIDLIWRDWKTYRSLCRSTR